MHRRWSLSKREVYSRMMRITGACFLGLAIIILLYYAIQVPTEPSFGQRYVTSEIPLIFPFYVISTFKPITLTIYFIFGGTILVLESSRDFLRRFDTRGTRILFTFLSFASGYELIWNFFAWFSTWQIKGGSLDELSNTQHSYLFLPVNFNFVTKLCFLIFGLSLYVALFLGRIEDDRLSSERRKFDQD